MDLEHQCQVELTFNMPLPQSEQVLLDPSHYGWKPIDHFVPW